MIEFAKKERNLPTNSCDVSVTIATAGNNKKTLRFSFSEKAAKMIAGETLFAQVGIDPQFPNRIYFCEATEKTGYKLSLSQTNKTTRRSCVFGNYRKYSNPESFIGCYKLFYDPKQEALYIDKSRKIKEA